jgi:hypothetical protein
VKLSARRHAFKKFLLRGNPDAIDLAKAREHVKV